MIVLVVEDNPSKRASLIDFYRSEYADDTVLTAASLISGLRTARDNSPDLIILDMTLPNYTSDENKPTTGELLPFAGREFIMRINRMGIATKIVIVSMFETFGVAPRFMTLSGLDDELRERYPKIFLGAVHYSLSQGDWKTSIKSARASLGEAN